MNLYFILLIFLFLNFLIYFNHDFLSKKLNIYDFPNSRKIHTKKIPSIGGIYLSINITFFIILFFILDNNDFFYSLNLENSLYFFIGFYLIFFLGLIDDKLQLNSNTKFFFCILICFLILNLETKLVIDQLTFKNLNFEINLGKFNYIFTILCFVIFINAFNMFDGINCQAVSYSIVFLLTLFFLHDLSKILIIIIIISLLNILILNFQNKVFLGDSGSLSIGYILSYFVIENYNFSKNPISPEEIFLLMIYPGTDMVRLFILRLYKRKNPFHADKSHMHHYIMEKFPFKISISISLFLFSSPIALYYFFNLKILFVFIYFYLIYSITLYNLKFKNK